MKTDLNITSQQISNIYSTDLLIMTYTIQTIDEVPGLYYIPNVIESSYAQQIIEKLDENDMQKWEQVTQHANSRLIQHFGYLYNYTSHDTSKKGNSLPDIIKPLRPVLKQICYDLNLLIQPSPDYKFNQCIVNNYLPGQGIGKHTDVKAYGKIIGCYSLNGGATMKFTNAKLCSSYFVYPEPNSLYIMSGDARYKWTHEMPARKSDTFNDVKFARKRRISVTFRHV
jgi:alkylated DNA repair dioxygenase AlkB